MTLTKTQKLGKLIHIARIVASNGRIRYIYLRKSEPEGYRWYEGVDDSTEEETPVAGPTIEETIRLAVKHWNKQAYRNVNCGFRYTLPERDEHGINAYFVQMASSQSSMNGVYYDEELGNNCYVQNASIESFNLWQRLKKEDRL
jgi:hypothetical protein